MSYYRPHLPVLLADLGCAVLVSATALALPLCANLITKRLAVTGDPAEVLGPILLMGAVMLGLLAVQALASFVVDFHGHLMGAQMEAALRRDLFERSATDHDPRSPGVVEKTCEPVVAPERDRREARWCRV